MSHAHFIEINSIKFQNTFPFMVQTKQPHVSRNLTWCWMIKEVIPVVKRLHAFFYLFFFFGFFLSNVSGTNFVQLLYNSNNFF
jgi:hypothetical protein